jgi:hypothetical protein
MRARQRGAPESTLITEGKALPANIVECSSPQPHCPMAWVFAGSWGLATDLRVE